MIDESPLAPEMLFFPLPHSYITSLSLLYTQQESRTQSQRTPHTKLCCLLPSVSSDGAARGGGGRVAGVVEEALLAPEDGRPEGGADPVVGRRAHHLLRLCCCFVCACVRVRVLWGRRR